MDKALLKKAKQLLKNQYGEALANKATDEFCLHATGAPITRSFGVESMSATAPQVPQPGVIMECAEQSIQKEVDKRKASPLNKKVQEFLKSIEGEEALTINLQQVLRQQTMKAFRERVIKNIHPYNAFLEKNIERKFAHGTESLQQQSYLTKVCWLNQTVRTIADPVSLAEIAADPQIIKFDVPRKLTREINETGKIVFASQYRQKFLQTGKGIIAAVIDSEVASSHKSFSNRVLHRENYTKEPWGNPDSHGTGVAGIIGSEDATFIGMAPNATIYNYKVLATNPLFDSDDFQASLAIEKALEDGAHLANCSWGAGPARDGTGREARACNTAWDLGLTIIKSAGNKGPGSGTLTTPADATGVIVVGATGKDGKEVQPYSSRGPLSSGENRPHLVAPGGSSPGGIFSCLTAGGFGDIGMGTSFAAPHVTGLLALILEGNQSLSPDEQRNFLLKLCTKLSVFTNDEQGAGFVSMASLL